MIKVPDIDTVHATTTVANHPHRSRFLPPTRAVCLRLLGKPFSKGPRRHVSTTTTVRINWQNCKTHARARRYLAVYSNGSRIESPGRDAEHSRRDKNQIIGKFDTERRRLKEFRKTIYFVLAKSLTSKFQLGYKYDEVKLIEFKFAQFRSSVCYR